MAIDYCSAQEGYDLMGVDYPGENDPEYSLKKRIKFKKRELKRTSGLHNL